jgi:hypothetical protein
MAEVKTYMVKSIAIVMTKPFAGERGIYLGPKDSSNEIFWVLFKWAAVHY